MNLELIEAVAPHGYNYGDIIIFTDGTKVLLVAGTFNNGGFRGVDLSTLDSYKWWGNVESFIEYNFNGKTIERVISKDNYKLVETRGK